MNEPRCEWCLFVLGRIRPGNHGHHVFGKHNPVVVRMCQPHHSEAYHTGGRITRQEIIDKILIVHHWNGEDKSGTYTRRIELTRISEDGC